MEQKASSEASAWALAAGSAQGSPIAASLIIASKSPTNSRRRPSSDSLSSHSTPGESIMEWRFDALHYTAHTKGKPLSSLARDIFRINAGFLGDMYTLTCRDIVAALTIAEKEYNTYDGKIYNVAYHSKAHGADVLQAFHYFLRSTPDILSAIAPSLPESVSPQLVLLASVFAAATHDLGHFGLNNDFLSKTRHPLAIQSENQSVLESYHGANALELLRKSSLVESTLSESDLKIFRKLVIELILATDLAKHFDMLANLPDVTDYSGMLGFAIHCADVSTVARPIDVSTKWVDLIMQEFFLQGDLERDLGLPVTPIMDRTSANFARVQIGFIDIISRPLFAYLGSQFKLTECVETLEQVTEYWEERI